jgi:hypothetical protein
MLRNELAYLPWDSDKRSQHYLHLHPVLCQYFLQTKAAETTT